MLITNLTININYFTYDGKKIFVSNSRKTMLSWNNTLESIFSNNRGKLSKNGISEVYSLKFKYLPQYQD